MKIIKWQYKFTRLDAVSTPKLVESHLNNLGGEGWELCFIKMPPEGSARNQPNSFYRFVWKRPIGMIESEVELMVG